MKRNLTFYVLCFMMLITSVIGLVGCGNGNKLISVNTDTLVAETKTTYYVGDLFSPSATYVNLKYYDKKSNTEYELLDYPLTSLSKEISDIEYEISGFDSSAPNNNQTVCITISSAQYPGEVSVSFDIQILPEYIVNAEVVNSSNYLKNCYSVNETLNYENFKIQNTYSNGRTETVDVTSDMVEEFNTEIASTQKKTLTITQNNFTISHDYAVVPNANYVLFDEAFVKCFVPSATNGFNLSKPELNIFEYSKSSVADLSLAYYERFPYSASIIINLYDADSLISYETRNINNISVSICKFKYNDSSAIITGIYFDKRITIQNGLTLSNFDSTIEILFIDYTNNTETSEILNTLLNSIS